MKGMSLLHKLGYIYKGCKRFLRNIWVFRSTLWNHCQYDYGSFYIFVEEMMEDMIKLDPHYSVCWEDKVRKMKVVRELARRLQEEDHFHFERKFDLEIDREYINEHTYRVSSKIHKLHDLPNRCKIGGKNIEIVLMYQDKDLLFKLLNKHLHSFWD